MEGRSACLPRITGRLHGLLKSPISCCSCWLLSSSYVIAVASPHGRSVSAAVAATRRRPQRSLHSPASACEMRRLLPVVVVAGDVTQLSDGSSQRGARRRDGRRTARPRLAQGDNNDDVTDAGDSPRSRRAASKWYDDGAFIRAISYVTRSPCSRQTARALHRLKMH